MPPSVTPTTRNTLFNLVLAVVGGVLLLITVRSVGWADVQSSLMQVGWWFPAIVALGGLRFAARSRAWMACTSGLPFWDAFSATLAGDALGNLTPLGLLASEPAKMLFAKERLPIVDAVSSVAAENAFYIGSVLVMIAAGALAFFGVADLPSSLRVGVQVVLAGVVAGGLMTMWIMRQRPAVLTRLARLVASLTGRGATSIDRLREIEVHFYALLTWPALRIARVCAWEALFHVAAVAEVYLVLRLLPGGESITVLEAFILETAGRLIVVAFKFVPYRLGVDEAGTALVARALSRDPALGVTLALVRRIRILCWNAVGLVILATRRVG